MKKLKNQVNSRLPLYFIEPAAEIEFCLAGVMELDKDGAMPDN